MIEKPKGSLISFFSTKAKLLGGINLAQGIPFFSPPKELLYNLSKISKNKNYHQYPSGKGIKELITHIKNHYNEYYQINCNEENILILHGATEALSLIYIYLKNKYKNLNVLCLDPAYEVYVNLVKIFNDNLFTINYVNFLDFESLKKEVINKKINLIFINSPGNPYGKVFTKQEMEEFFNISKELNVNLVIDAVYRELFFWDKPFIPIDLANENLFYVNSFSKIYSITGWRVGYVISSAENISNLQAIHDYTGLCVVHPMQIAISNYIKENGFISNYVLELREKIKKSYIYFFNEIQKLGFEPISSDGGYFILAKLPKKFDDGFLFALNLFEKEKVAVVPAENFSPNFLNYVRFNIAMPINTLKKAISHIKRFVFF